MKYKIGLKEYRDLFQQAPDGIFILDPSGYFILVNRRFCELTQYSSAELLKMHVLATYLESEMDLFASRLSQLNSQKSILVERSFKCKDGSIFYAQINIQVMDNGWLKGIVHDVMVDQDILEQLHLNEERYRQITEHIRDVFFLIDLSTGNFLYASPGYEKIWKKSVQSLLKEPSSWMEMVHPEDKKIILKASKKLQKTGCFDITYRIVRSDQTIRWIHARAFPIYNINHQLYRSAGIAEDVTELLALKRQGLQDRLTYSENILRGFHETIVAMSTAVEQRDAYTAGHESNVAYLSIAIAKELKLSNDQLDCIDIAAQVHDIGKIGVPIEILTKPNQLSHLEFELIKTHSQIGYNILKNIHFPWPVAEIVLQHHERLNGSGYPRGLKGDAILFETKIISVADTVDAMASYRPYRPAKGLKAALAEIHNQRGVLYDPVVVDACEQLFRKKKITIYSKG